MGNSSTMYFGLIILLMVASLFSQTIVSEKWYGDGYNDIGYEAIELSNGGFFITGIYQQSYYNETYLIETDAMGESQHTYTYGSTSWDNGRTITATYDSNYVIGGRTFTSSSTYTGDANLIKIDANGSEIWNKKYGGSNKDGCMSLIQASDSGLVFTGQINYSDFWVLKTDTGGTQLWSRTYGAGIGYKIIETSDQNYLVAGALGNSNEDMYIVKLNSSNGDTIWTCTIGGVARDWGYGLCERYDGGYVCFGSTNSFGAGNYDYYFAEISSDGDTISTRTLGMSGTEYGHRICQTPDNGYIACGSTNSIGAGLGDIYIAKLDANLDTVWTETYGGTGEDAAYHIFCTHDDYYVVIGSTQSYGLAGDVYFLKLSEDIHSDIDTPGVHVANNPKDYALSQNYPNPFNPSTKVSFTVPESQFVTINIYNVNGQLIETAFSGYKSPGTHELLINGAHLASGVYFYDLTAGSFHQTNKMILIR